MYGNQGYCFYGITFIDNYVYKTDKGPITSVMFIENDGKVTDVEIKGAASADIHTVCYAQKPNKKEVIDCLLDCL